MKHDITKRSQRFYDIIQDPILHDVYSPYHKVANELHKFEASHQDTYLQQSQTLPEYANEEFQHKQVMYFLDRAKQKTEKANDLEYKIIKQLKTHLENDNNIDEARKDLALALAEMRDFVHSQLFYEPVPEHSGNELKNKRSDAEKITFFERLIKSNDEDIADYYVALTHSIIRDSRIAVRKHFGQYILKLCDRITYTFNLLENHT